MFLPWARWPVARSAFAAPAECSVTVRADRPLGMIASDFMGLGYEISSVARPGLLSRANQVYVQLVRTLGAHGVIRIGGNTADYANYSPNAAAVSSSRGTVVNDAVLKDLGGFLEATGWKLIWALDLGKGSEADAIAEGEDHICRSPGNACWPSKSAMSRTCSLAPSIASRSMAMKIGSRNTAATRQRSVKSFHAFRLRVQTPR